MTSSNGSDRISRLEDLVLSLAQTFNQAQPQQQTLNQQISDRLSEFIKQSNENFTTLSEAHRVTEHQIAALAESQRETNEAVHSIGENVSTLTNQVIPQFVTRMEEMQSEIRGLQAENRRIIERVFGENGGQQ